MWANVVNSQMPIANGQMLKTKKATASAVAYASHQGLEFRCESGDLRINPDSHRDSNQLS